MKYLESFAIFENNHDFGPEYCSFLENKSGTVGGFFTVKHTKSIGVSYEMTDLNLRIPVSGTTTDREEASNYGALRNMITELFRGKSQESRITRVWGNTTPLYKIGDTVTLNKDILERQDFRVEVECNRYTFYIKGSGETFDVEIPSQLLNKTSEGERFYSQVGISACFNFIQQMAR